jgi:6-phosphogluconolactonase (cycloisomerase 2 family)
VTSLVFVATFAFPSSALAQSAPQQYVYGAVPITTASSEIDALAKNAQTGALTSISGSPFADRMLGYVMAVDGLGRFLFVVNKNTSNISMFQIDQSTGALNEVSGSPFSTGAVENPNMTATLPVCVATEKSGRFLYVGYQQGNYQALGAVNEFTIDATGLQLVPLPVQPTLDIPSSPIGMFVDPKGLHLYVGLGLNVSTGVQDAGTNVYAIDSTTGQLTFTGSAGNALDTGRGIALDAQGRFFFDAWGGAHTFLDSALISPADGTATSGVNTLALPPGDVPSAMLTESSGKFLYVKQNTASSFVYSIDQLTGALTPGPAVSSLNFQPGTAAADPLGPYLYSLQNDGIHAFLIDSQSGLLSEIPGSPFLAGSGALGPLTITGAPVQAVSGPIAALFPSSQDFGSVTVGQSSMSRAITLTDTGDQALSVNSITLVGANPAEFSAIPTCAPPTLLQPNATCTISVVFTPAQTGARSASLVVSDNAPGSPQSVSLTGIGLAAQPAVTLNPGTLTFPATTQGTTAPSQTVTLASAGSATLHISSVLLGGSNPSDFTMSNSCSGALAPNQTCTIDVSFTPLGAGSRIGTISITDDAPNSPQNISLSGTGIASQSGVSLSSSALSFPATTQGVASPSQTITLTSSGTAALHIASIVLAGTDPSDFAITTTCSGAYSSNATCSISVAFAPLATGLRSATVSISDDAPNSPQTISLSGDANPAFTVSTTSANGLSATVAAGQTATYSLQLTPGSGFTGSISFACTGAPFAASCSAPAVQVLNSNPVSFTVNVTTTGAAAALATPGPQISRPNSIQNATTPACWIAVALLLLLALRPNRITSQWHRLQSVQLSDAAACRITFLLLLCFGVFHASGCGGGTLATSVAVTHTVTPQGTFTLTVTPAANSSTGKPLQLPPFQLTLTVQ